MSTLAILVWLLAITLLVWLVETFILDVKKQRPVRQQILANPESVSPQSIVAVLKDSSLSVWLGQIAVGLLFAQLFVIFSDRKDVDFSLVLVIATGLSGLLWLLYIVTIKSLRETLLAKLPDNMKASDAKVAKEMPSADLVVLKRPALIENAASFFPVLLVVLVVRSFLFEPFTIPSGSMLPTLKIGDYIVVNKFAYGVRLPVLNTVIIPTSKPQRGDVMVFKYPENPSINFIKRVIGLPGDRIKVEDGRLTINGQALPYQDALPEGAEKWETYYHLEEINQIKHFIQQEPNLASPQASGEWVVPEDSYFTLGDNRSNSRDSRFWGTVPDRLIVGKASFVWMHKEPGWTTLPSFSTVGKIH